VVGTKLYLYFLEAESNWSALLLLCCMFSLFRY